MPVIKHGNLNNFLESVVCATDDELCMTGCFLCAETKALNTSFIGQDDEIKFFKWVRVTERRIIKGKEKDITFTTKQP